MNDTLHFFIAPPPLIPRWKVNCAGRIKEDISSMVLRSEGMDCGFYVFGVGKRAL